VLRCGSAAVEPRTAVVAALAQRAAACSLANSLPRMVWMLFVLDIED